MYRASFCLLLICVATAALGKSRWIHAVGIDENTPAQNYDNFYMQAGDFQKACAMSPQQPECTLFVNLNYQLAANPDSIEKIAQINKDHTYRGNANPPNVKGAIIDALKKSKSGDQVIISLSNHGAPSKTSASCVYFNSFEKICDAELKAILKSHKPPGVKVLIRADGCYSGAFSELSGPEVCAITTADRTKVGYSINQNLWNQISTGRIKRVSDLRVPLNRGLDISRDERISSQAIVRNNCETARKALARSDRDTAIKLAAMQNRAMKRPQDCTIGLGSMRMESIHNWINELLTPLSCEASQAPRYICEAVQRLQKTSVSAQVEELNKLVMKAQELRQSFEKDWPPQNLSDKKHAYLIANYLMHPKPAISPEAADLSPEETESFNTMIKTQVQKREAMVNGPIKELQDQSKPLIEQIEKVGYFSDALLVHSCFSEVMKTEMAPTGIDQVHWETLAGRHKTRMYSPRELQKVIECENSIEF